MDFIVSFFCKKDEPIKDNSDEEVKLVNNTNPVGEVVTKKEDTEPTITEQVDNTVNNDDKNDEVDAVTNPGEKEEIDDKKDEVDAVTNHDEVEDALMKAEETDDEDTLIQIVEDMLMRYEETGDETDEEEIEEEIEVDENESI